jgi:hypothetical protein
MPIPPPTPYSPIQGPLSFTPGGNPFAGAAGGIGGIANEYGKSYTAALGQNQQMYQNILGGYQQLGQGVQETIGGIGQAASQNIADTYAQQSGALRQGLTTRGLGNTTVNDSMQAGLLRDKSRADIALADQLAQLRAGYQSQLGLGQLGWMNSVSAQYPDTNQYQSIYRDQGLANQHAAEQRMLQRYGGPQTIGGGGGGGPPLGSRGRPNLEGDYPFGTGRETMPISIGGSYGGPSMWDTQAAAAQQYGPSNLWAAQQQQADQGFDFAGAPGANYDRGTAAAAPALPYGAETYGYGATGGAGSNYNLAPSGGEFSGEPGFDEYFNYGGYG